GIQITVPDGDADFDLTVIATATETANNSTASTPGTIHVDVHAVADAPSLSVSSPATGVEGSTIPLSISASLTDPSGEGVDNDSLSITVSGLPSGATLTQGTDNGD